jgi:hypothetical protein
MDRVTGARGGAHEKAGRDWETNGGSSCEEARPNFGPGDDSG